jgi:2-polyprenyl-3-methyl-5-hydroxy-6-metoxy-1,4-benzoquinol methylase
MGRPIVLPKKCYASAMPVSATGRPEDLTDQVTSGDMNFAYVAFHRPRFEFLIETLRPYTVGEGCRILDVGVSRLTSLLATNLKVQVDSLGLEANHQILNVRHWQFDLNDAQYRERWRTDIGPYDIVVFAEVVEHLYTAPELILAYLKELLVPGGVLLLQTPNAVALRKRARMLVGLNPFERIRFDRNNPGHFREYTVAELREFLFDAGFAIDKVWMKYYFDARYARHHDGNEPASQIVGAIKNAIYRFLPGPLQEGITIVAHKNRT